MARSYAQLTTAGLTDPDWLDLTDGAQWLYVVLLRQARLTMWGTGDLLPKRWITARAVTLADIDRRLAELEDAAFVHVDRSTDEFIIRSFTRHDLRAKVLSGPVVKGMWSSWSGIQSEPIRVVAVQTMPDECWAKLEPTAPAAAGHIRRSPSFEWKRPSSFKSEWPPSFECPSTLHLPPSTFHPLAHSNSSDGYGVVETPVSVRVGAA